MHGPRSEESADGWMSQVGRGQGSLTRRDTSAEIYSPRDPGKERPRPRKEPEQTSEKEEAHKVPPLSQPWTGKLFLLKLFESYYKNTPKIKALFIILPLLRQ